MAKLLRFTHFPKCVYYGHSPDTLQIVKRAASVSPTTLDIGVRCPRRTGIPVRPAGEWQLAETLRSLIGQKLLSLPIPVQYHEPLSLLQR